MSQGFSSIYFLAITLNRRRGSSTEHQSPAVPKGVIMTAHSGASDEIPSNHTASASTQVCLLIDKLYVFPTYRIGCWMQTTRNLSAKAVP